jgi:hypothetical protein
MREQRLGIVTDRPDEARSAAERDRHVRTHDQKLRGIAVLLICLASLVFSAAAIAALLFMGQSPPGLASGTTSIQLPRHFDFSGVARLPCE